jgi:hypothetical protein
VANPIAMQVSPTNPALKVGATLQFSCIANFADGTTQDVTTDATWNSSQKTVAIVGNAGTSKGLAKGLATGTTSISAALAGVGGSTTLAVTP